MSRDMTASKGFIQGVGAGALGAVVAGSGLLLWLGQRDAGPGAPGELWNWAWHNLGLSLPVFAVVLLLFVRSLSRLVTALKRDAAVDEVAQLEHLADTWTSLFFGVGVIWTAIGLRQALIFALGDPEASMAAGAFEMLRRLVDGGILIALSTTIFGGIGGYLMRVIKTLSVGAALRRYYGQVMLAPTRELAAAVQRIEAHLQTTASSAEAAS